MSPMKRASTVDGLKRGMGTAVSDSGKSVTPGAIDLPPDLPPAKPAKKWTARISMTASREMKRDLEAARIDDGIEVTARLRAMITLWQEDPQLRARVDELAKSLR